MGPMIKIHARTLQPLDDPGRLGCRWAGKTPTSWQRCDIGYAPDQLGGVLDLGKRFLEQTRGNSPPLQRFG
jgi:hypothetical protein